MISARDSDISDPKKGVGWGFFFNYLICMFIHMLRKLVIFFGGGGGWRFFRLSHMYERSYAEEARCSRKWV